jgi:NAD(P)-dependent dehydrogenase (short-subunit alcohol dehydrogenase family)
MSGLKLNGKIAIVTGGGGGLGAAIGHQLADAGAHVALFGRTPATLEAAAKAIGKAAIPVVVDLADPASVDAGVAAVAAAYGGIDMLINNAAIFPLGRIEKMSNASIRLLFDTNVLGPIYCSRAVIPTMRARDGGHIVNISSESVHTPMPHLTGYVMSKAALEMLTTCLRNELFADRIRITTVRSGRMISDKTEMPPGWDMAEMEEFFAECEKAGVDTYLGPGMAYSTVAASVLHAVTAPDDSNIDMIEIRSY